MSIPVKRKVKVLEARYVEEAQAILIVGECSEGRLRTQIHRNCFLYGNRTEPEIKKELENTAQIMIGKTIEMVFDTELDGKIKDHVSLRY